MATPPPTRSGCLRRAGVGVLLLLTACSSWRVQPVTPVELVSEQQPSKVRLQAHGGREIVLRSPFLRGDSVLGVARRDTTGLPAAEIRTIAVRRFDWLKTTGLLVGIAGGLVGGACLVACGWGSVGLGG